MGQSNVHVNSGLVDARDEVEGSECVGDLLVAPTVVVSYDLLTSILNQFCIRECYEKVGREKPSSKASFTLSATAP